MHTKHQHILRGMRVGALGILCVVASFAFGIHTAGDVQTIASLQAGGTDIPGDMNGDGAVTVDDVVAILEIVQGQTDASAYQLKVDPIRDGQLTISDALSLLQQLAR